MQLPRNCTRAVLLLLAFLPLSTSAVEWAAGIGGTSVEIARDVALDGMGNSLVAASFFADVRLADGAVVLNSEGATDSLVAKYASDGALLWVSQIGGSGVATVAGVDSDAVGNVYVAGNFAGEVRFGTGGGAITLMGRGDFDVFIASFDPSGGLRWAHAAGGTGRDYLGGFDFLAQVEGDGLVVDAQGNATVTGFFTGSASFGEGASEETLDANSASDTDVFLARYDTTGALAWARRIGGPGAIGDGIDLALDPAGDVRVLGLTTGETVLDGQVPVALPPLPASSQAHFVAAYAPDGQPRSGFLVGEDTRPVTVTAIAADSDGTIHVTGYWPTNDIVLGTGEAAVTVPGLRQENDLFVASYGTDGVLEDVLIARDAIAFDLAVDPEDNLWLTGSLSGRTPFGAGDGDLLLTDTGGRDAFVVGIASSGAVFAGRKIGGPETQGFADGYGVAPGSAVVAGRFFGEATFDGNTGRRRQSIDNFDGFAARFDDPFDAADLVLAASVDDASPDEGAPVTFQVTIRNDGPDDATAVQVLVPVPNGLGSEGATPSRGTYDASTGVWTLGPLPEGTQESLTLTGTARQASPIVFNAVVHHADQADPLPANEEATVTADPILAPGSSSTVSTTANDGPGSLRNALEFVSEASIRGEAPVAVTFAIPGGDPGCDNEGVCTIRPLWPLPPLRAPALVDGLSQPGADCGTWPPSLKIVIDGALVDRGASGLHLAGGGATVRGLVISGHRSEPDPEVAFSVRGGAGVLIDSDGNRVACSILGTDVTGRSDDSDFANEFGVRIEGGADNVIGGSAIASRNLMSNNEGAGISIRGPASAANRIEGNLVGTNIDGAQSLENDAGIVIENAPDTIVGAGDHTAGACDRGCNLISGNDDEGILIDGPDAVRTVIAGNFIGTNLSGAAPLDNDDGGILIVDAGAGHRIGGPSRSPDACDRDCNLVSGNEDDGIVVDSGSVGEVVIQGNFVGTDATGLLAVPNDGAGIVLEDGLDNVVGGPGPGAGNLIAGNEFDGIEIDTDLAVIQGNVIGADVTGAGPLPNEGQGIEIFGFGNLIGGLLPGAGNIIAFHQGVGVEVTGGCCPTPAGNRIVGNATFANAGIALDLGGDGATANDPGDEDEGPNRLQNAPVLATAAGDGVSTVTIEFAVATAATAATYPLAVDFYLADADGEEGAAWLGRDTYLAGDAQASVIAAIGPARSVSDGTRIVATATDAEGNTGEFSASVVVSGSAEPPREELIFRNGFEALME